ncbi:KAP family NTPase [Poseidonibacter lekithochrous]|uniref:P-loop NTPase fold protein n=1 Tax=Poseidonibacter TaxID=2321187 RepID=UPI001C086E6C|nr:MULTISPECIES: P-loop NTPase fold protein [Poseidonibacter]MBU3015803.1 KAP family NTPase [Poseidonibacter lekithochrous]MDO6829103.1 P-loop NTPase fold protein [Poseidonibacter sp. 1_MG-2023]
MSVKTNQERIKKYLVGEQGYLKSDLSNGKVIMLSGKWGSGKTHFWQNYIANDELKKELNEKNSAYSYISLYGKSSIEEIENDIFGQIYFSAIGGDNLATKIFSTFTKYSKRYGKFLPSFDLSKLANSLQEEQADNKERTALERLNNGGIICFDDFERKSKDIDLNDLFGFITQLTLNFKCKVVIILNDDVFEGKEKDVFSNVKEKTVSKFLKYEPSIRDLFKSIVFEREEDNKKFKYSKLKKQFKIILKTIEETEELNARIYIQILDNLVEWVDKEQKINDDILRCLILVNINFILNHKVFELKKVFEPHEDSLDGEDGEYVQECFVKLENSEDSQLNSIVDLTIGKDTNIELSKAIYKNNQIEMPAYVEKLLKDKELIYSMIFNKLDISRKVDDKTFQKINDFIETGILIDE